MLFTLFDLLFLFTTRDLCWCLNFFPQVRLNLGMYIVFLLDWLTVFHREQILVLRLEDYAANLKMTIKEVFDFLSIGM